MICAFVDASALYSGIISKTGAMRELLRRQRQNTLRLVISRYVTTEVHNTIYQKAAQFLTAFDLLLDLLDLDEVVVSEPQIRQAANYTELKDAPVVAAAIASGCGYLLTYDRKHLLDPKLVAQQSGLTICTPGDLLQQIKADEGE